MKRHLPLRWAPVCRVESASTCEFGKVIPSGEGEENEKGGMPHDPAQWRHSCCLCAAPGLYILGSIYLHSSYDMSLTTRNWLSFQNEEGSNACALPCGVGGIGWGVGQVGDDRKWPVPRPACTHTLQKAAAQGAARASATTVARKAIGCASAAPRRGRRPLLPQTRVASQHRRTPAPAPSRRTSQWAPQMPHSKMTRTTADSGPPPQRT